MKKLQLGIAPIGWSNDDLPELGGDISLDSCLKDMQSIGYAGTELGNKFPTGGTEIKTLLKSYNLVLASSWHSTFFLQDSFSKERTRLESKLEQLVDAGAKNINICECTGSVHGIEDKALSTRPRMRAEDWTPFAKNMSEAGKICSDYGIKLCYHHHMGTVVQSQEEIETLLESTDPEHVFLCFDTGHLSFAGADPLVCWQIFSSRVRHVHLKDIRENILKKLMINDWSFLKGVKEGVFTVPGDGGIDFRPLIHKILDSNYSGWLLVEAEQDPSKADPYTYAKRAYAFLGHLIEYNSATH